MTKQVGAAPDCFVISPGKLQDNQAPKAATINIQREAESSLNQKTRKDCQEVPRAQAMTKQGSACARLLSKQPWKVTGRSDKGESHNQHPKVAEEPLSEPSQRTSQRTPEPEMLTKQVSAAPDCLVSHHRKTSGPRDQREGHNAPNGTPAQRRKIQISEITQKEFHEAYKKGETTGVMKFSQKERQIYLRKINISTEVAIRNKKERRTRTKIQEDSLETMVPQEYHDLLPAFEKGEKTSLPPHRPGIDLEINMEEGVAG